MSISRAFSLAHQLLCRGHLGTAVQILEWIRRELPDDRRVEVLSARAEARRGNYDACNRWLNQAFQSVDERADICGPLHTAIVFRASNLLADARTELSGLCARFPQFPSFWLFAGDLWLAVGRPDRATNSWRMAMRRDGQDPRLVEAAARHRIAELRDSTRPSRKATRAVRKSSG